MSLDARLSQWGLRLQKRFNASQSLKPEISSINENVQPVTNVDELLRDYRSFSTNASVTATGMLTLFTMPTNAKYRFTILAFDITLSTGTYKFDQITLNTQSVFTTLEDRPGTVSAVTLDYPGGKGTGVTEYASDLIQGLVLYPGDFIAVDINTKSVNGFLNIDVYGFREAIF